MPAESTPLSLSMSGGKNQRDRSKSARKTAGSPLKLSAKTDWKLSGKLGWDITSRALDAENRGLYVGWQALVHNLPFMVYGSGTGTQSAVYGLWFRRWYTICCLWFIVHSLVNNHVSDFRNAMFIAFVPGHSGRPTTTPSQKKHA